ncbi:MAG: hypothetical protein ABIT36_07000 [Steroidobacteraceae bacterium]
MRPLILVALCLLGAHATAAYLPAADATVLEAVPAASRMRELQPLRLALASQPDNPSAAVNLARGYLAIGRNDGDPRFLSYAEATLAPWLRRDRIPADVLVVAAIVYQSSHRFSEALALLDRALILQPRHPQGLLTRATILQVRGDFTAARTTCAQLVQAAGQLVAVACLSAANAMNGHLPESQRALRAVFVDDPRLDAGLRSWIRGQLGEMALRLNDPRQAERDFVAGLRDAPQDLYLKAAYADLLIDRQRPAEALRLLRDNEAQDILLLRLAIAATRVGDGTAQRYARLYQGRYDAAQRDGDATHAREHARFQLEVRKNSAEALRLAQRNWQVQREPADISLYLRAACAAHSTDAHSQISGWIRDNAYQDAALAPLLACPTT